MYVNLFCSNFLHNVCMLISSVVNFYIMCVYIYMDDAFYAYIRLYIVRNLLTSILVRFNNTDK